MSLSKCTNELTVQRDLSILISKIVPITTFRPKKLLNNSFVGKTLMKYIVYYHLNYYTSFVNSISVLGSIAQNSKNLVRYSSRFESGLGSNFFGLEAA
jgi:hypothetical protein